MFEPESIRARLLDLSGGNVDNLMQIVATCKEILDSQGVDMRASTDVTAVLRVGETAHFRFPYPKVFLLTDADRPFPNEWLQVSSALYFPSDGMK